MKFTLRDLSSSAAAKRSKASRADYYEGSGTPEGVVTGKIGDVYFRLDGGSGTTIYFKESGTNTNTGWIARGTSGTTDHQLLTNRSAVGAHPASSISTDTTNFNNNLSVADTTVQLALDTIDNFNITRGWLSQQIFVATAGQVDFTITSFAFDANSKLTVLYNGLDIDEGGGLDWVRNVALTKITFNEGVTANARIKVVKWA